MKMLWRKYKGQLIITFIVFCMIFLTPFYDVIERNFFVEDLTSEDINVGDFVSIEHGLLDLYDGLGQEVSMQTGVIYLERGSYKIAANFETEAAGHTFEVVNPYALKEDNTPEKVLLFSEIPTSGQGIQTELVITEAICPVQFRICYNGTGGLIFKNIYLRSEENIYWDSYVFAGLFFLASLCLLFYRRNHQVDFFTLILLAGGAVWCSIPMGFTWLLNGHDLYFHYGRLYNLSANLLNGTYPLRLYTGMYKGFGYSPSVFYPELMLIPAACLRAFHVSMIGCYKALILFINFGTAGIGYFSFKRILKDKRMGLIAAFLYLFSTYRLIDLYTRAAIGEALAMMFLPLLLWSLYELFRGNAKYWPWATLAFTGLLQSHLVMTELVVYGGALFALCSLHYILKWERLSRILLAGGTALLLNLWFMIPLLHHSAYPVLAFEDVRELVDYSLHLSQLFDVNMQNVTGVSVFQTIQGEMPYSIGIVLLIGAILFLTAYVQQKKNGFQTNSEESDAYEKQKERKNRMEWGMICLVLGAAAAYASTIYFPWGLIQKLPLANRMFGNIQFAFRFLPFATLFLSITSVIGVYEFFQTREVKRLGIVFVCSVALLSSGVYLGNFCDFGDIFVNDESLLDKTQMSDRMYLLTEYDMGGFSKVNDRTSEFTSSEGVVLFDTRREGSTAEFSYEKPVNAADAWVGVSLNYYPNYHAYDETGRELSISNSENLRLTVRLPEDKETGTVTVYYEEPVLYHIGEWISILTALVFVMILLGRHFHFSFSKFWQ